ncbi:transcriptional regulator, TetR family [Lentzea albidocapillata subsp. violacea]|uniref:Transcriptional regulator, TetR family n=1 Tax=Lentzea albidocapillata subsp. violacea TaxID=128104 RepID=A0A1G8YCT2_9PSEU|nr:TetR/AcrR family transcriptional regulator [Lentzea albidocapillata]SDK00648.1 transcriptional regulator, TetR family [Lentzea albidocapillata subsp. violacea]
MAAALDVIADHGPWVSTDQIAERAGIARPALYRHFADADDLYDTVALRIGELLISAMAPALIRPAGSAREIITRIVSTFVVWTSGNPFLYQYVISRSMEAAQRGERQLAADVREQIAELLRRLLGDYIVLFEGDPRIADPLAFGLAGMVESTTARWIAVDRQFDRDQLISHLAGWAWAAIDVVLRDIGVTLDPDIALPALPESDS